MRVPGIIHVRIDFRPPSRKKLCSIRWEEAPSGAPFHAGFGEFAIEVAVRAHFYGGPIGEAAVVHGEAIVVFKDRNDVPGA